ncbi:Outer membrane porin, OprD family [Azotobacter chroococcum NCIMB 8003]|uniref:Outer membrane porin, OprD family n=2 Tax=Azotobacter chroococcum TaxID=353 RepID=A0A0C4WG26_9GAMM|nr:Outer membrane porin, OprD family [Azotobacter chroococcum NCIMB 8003]
MENNKMTKATLALAVSAGILGLSASQQAAAEFFKDSKASLELRNFYMNKDFRDEVSAAPNQQAKQDEWAQGFILRYESGYTEGPVGFGLDMLGLLGVKLDSSPADAGTGLLPGGYNNRAPDDYSELGVTGKVRISKSELKVGTLLPKNPVLVYNDTRLLPQTFQGSNLQIKEIQGLTLDFGYLDQVNYRNSTNNEEMSLVSANRRNITIKRGGENEANFFMYGGATYQFTKELAATYYYGELDDLYKQHAFNVVHVLPLGKNSLKTDLRYARSTDDGEAHVDNHAFGLLTTYAMGAHKFGLGLQKMQGDTGFAQINGTDPFLVNYIQVNDFANADERSWQLRYDYDFAALGIPGLTFMTRYVSGDHVDRGPGSDGKEWERDTDIAYVFQSGMLKNLSLKWRNATMRSNFVRDVDENRLIVSYTLPLM